MVDEQILSKTRGGKDDQLAWDATLNRLGLGALFDFGFGFYSHAPNPCISGRFRSSGRAKRPMVNDPLPGRP